MAVLETGHLYWQGEDISEMVRGFVRQEVMIALKDIIGEGTWLKELVEAELRKVVPELAHELKISSGKDSGDPEITSHTLDPMVTSYYTCDGTKYREEKIPRTSTVNGVAPINVTVQLDGEKIAQVVAPHLVKLARSQSGRRDT